MNTNYGSGWEKRERYAVAFERISRAQELGFFVEAIMIAESVVTDRLVSLLRAFEGKRFLNPACVCGCNA